VEQRLYREVANYVLSLLSRKDYSLKLLREKVLDKFPSVSHSLLDSLLAELELEGFIDERRAVWNYFSEKEKKGWGKKKIAHHLYLMGFREEVIREVELSFTFNYSFIKEVLKRRYGARLTGKDREKAKRFLLQRGFSFLEAEEILSSLDD
jgi:regulatory protein